MKKHDAILSKQLAQSFYKGSMLTLLATTAALPSSQSMAQAAPESAQISFKTLSYRDYQPGIDRINVDASALLFEMPIAGQWSVSASAVHDAISGASPLYHSSGITDMTDSRDAFSASVTRYFSQASTTVSTSYSKERDYLSHSYSLQNTFSTASKNTTLILGLSYNDDQILPNSIFLSEKKEKRVLETVVGLTQVLSKNDIGQAILRHARGRGYYSDQYKLYDARPDTKDINSLMLRWNHYFESSDTALRSTYRYYDDSYGIRSQTLGVEAVFSLPYDWHITPSLRYYSQSAAYFYADPVANDPWADAGTLGAPISVVYPLYVSGEPTSMDQRLSAFGAWTAGVKLEKALTSHWNIDVKVEQYQQRGAWALSSGSPGLPKFSARSLQFGLSYRF